MEPYIAYIRMELDDNQLEKLIKKVGQPMDSLEDTLPKLIIYKGTQENDHIPVYPQILKVIDSKDRRGRLILEGKVYPGEKSFEIAIET